MAIKNINVAEVQRITSGQVIIDLVSIVKELVENSIDSGASKIEILFKNNGLDSIEVIDDGSGIEKEDFKNICIKHCTSKLESYEDLHNVNTLGFRGEALSSLAAISNLKIVTCTKKDLPRASELEFNSMGHLISEKKKIGGSKGTAVTVKNIFYNLPVRSKNLQSNIKREFGKAMAFLTNYLIIHPNIRFSIYNLNKNNKKNLILGTVGTKKATILDNLVTIFGSNGSYGFIPIEIEVKDLEAKFKLVNEQFPTRKTLNIKFEGYISDSSFGMGRSSADRQYLYINKRPIILKKFLKTINEVYKSYNHIQIPAVILNINIGPLFLDVNVTPDKRVVLIHNEDLINDILRNELIKFYDKHGNAIPKNSQKDVSFVSDSNEINLNNIVPKYTKELKQKRLILEKHPHPVASLTQIMEENIEDYEELVQEDEEICEEPSIEEEEIHDHSNGLSLDDDTSDHEKLQKEHKDKIGKENVNARYQKNLTKKQISSNLEEKNYELDKGHRDDVINLNLGDTHIGTIEKVAEIERIEDDSDINGKEISQDKIEETPQKDTLDTNDCVNLTNESYSTINNSVESSNDIFSSNINEITSSITIDNEGGTSQDLQDLRKKKAPKPILNEDTTESLFVEEINLEFDSNFLNKEEARDQNHSLKIRIGDKSFEERLPKRARLNSSKESGKLLKKQISKSDIQCLTSFMKIDLEDLNPYLVNNLFHNSDIKQSGKKPEVDSIAAKDAEDKLSYIISKLDFLKMKVIGQFNLGFILVTLNTSNNLFIIDQHASDEKYNFEKLTKTTQFQGQPLVISKTIELNVMDEITVQENMEVFKENGFIIRFDENSPPGRRIKLLALPMLKNTIFDINDFHELIHLVNSGTSLTNQFVKCSKIRSILAMRACRSSIMIGQHLNKRTMENIVTNLNTLEKPWNCPHGRPTMRHLIELKNWPSKEFDYEI